MFKEKLDKYGINNECFPIHRLTRNRNILLRYVLFFLPEIIILNRFFTKQTFEIVHCSGGSWQYKGLIAGKIAGAKTLWHLNDTGMPFLVRLLFRFIASRFVDGFIVAGKSVENYYLETFGLCGRPVFEIQAPVDTGYYRPSEAGYDETISKTKGLKVITLGNLNPTKGFEYFMSMAATLNLQYNDLHFFIIGPVLDSQKRYSDKLRKLKEDLHLNNLYFYGFCQDVRSVLNSADIYVCSSIAEASPLSVWEAMSMEKGIVSTDVGDVGRFLADEESGFIVPTEDPRRLAAKVGILIENPELRSDFGKKAREAAKKYLDINVVARRHIEAYHSILTMR